MARKKRSYKIRNQDKASKEKAKIQRKEYDEWRTKLLKTKRHRAIETINKELVQLRERHHNEKRALIKQMSITRLMDGPYSKKDPISRKMRAEARNKASMLKRALKKRHKKEIAAYRASQLVPLDQKVNKQDNLKKVQSKLLQQQEARRRARAADIEGAEDFSSDEEPESDASEESSSESSSDEETRSKKTNKFIPTKPKPAIRDEFSSESSDESESDSDAKPPAKKARVAETSTTNKKQATTKKDSSEEDSGEEDSGSEADSEDSDSDDSDSE